MNTKHEFYMAKAIELSKKGIGYVNPNPMVGCVIVKNDRIIGEGYHKRFGDKHAEVEAIDSAKESIQGSTLYVTLEPCCHYGKTPPCTNLIIESGIKEVYIAMLDPNPIVKGKSINILEKNHISVNVGILRQRVEKLNEVFIKYITSSLPFITLKSAISLDGKIATHKGDSKWISCIASRKEAHHLRHKYMGIMIGINTIIKDNPRLNIRLDNFKGRNPYKIIVDSTLKLPMNSNILRGNTPIIIGTTKYHQRDKLKQLESMGAKVVVVDDINKHVNLNSLVKVLGNMNIDSILLEGGGTLAYSALKMNIVDKVDLFVAPIIIGGGGLSFVNGLGADSVTDAFKLENLTYSSLDKDLYIQGYIRKDDDLCLQD